jgi:hypothetical protein
MESSAALEKEIPRPVEPPREDLGYEPREICLDAVGAGLFVVCGWRTGSAGKGLKMLSIPFVFVFFHSLFFFVFFSLAFFSIFFSPFYILMQNSIASQHELRHQNPEKLVLFHSPERVSDCDRVRSAGRGASGPGARGCG